MGGADMKETQRRKENITWHGWMDGWMDGMDGWMDGLEVTLQFCIFFVCAILPLIPYYARALNPGQALRTPTL
jgi:hypothetical protein